MSCWRKTRPLQALRRSARARLGRWEAILMALSNQVRGGGNRPKWVSGFHLQSFDGIRRQRQAPGPRAALDPYLAGLARQVSEVCPLATGWGKQDDGDDAVHRLRRNH